MSKLSVVCDLVFPVTRTHTNIRKVNNGYRVSVRAAVYLAAALEYLTAELAEVSGNQARARNRKARLVPSDFRKAIEQDKELAALMQDMFIPGAGYTPYVNVDGLFSRQKLAISSKKKKSARTKTAESDVSNSPSGAPTPQEPTVPTSHPDPVSSSPSSSSSESESDKNDPMDVDSESPASPLPTSAPETQEAVVSNAMEIDQSKTTANEIPQLDAGGGLSSQESMYSVEENDTLNTNAPGLDIFATPSPPSPDSEEILFYVPPKKDVNSVSVEGEQKTKKTTPSEEISTPENDSDDIFGMGPPKRPIEKKSEEKCDSDDDLGF